LSFTSEIDSYYYPLQLVKKKNGERGKENKNNNIIAMGYMMACLFGIPMIGLLSISRGKKNVGAGEEKEVFFYIYKK